MNLFGYSAGGLPIFHHCFKKKGPGVLILGGVHGDEPEGIYVAFGLLADFFKDFPYKLNLTIIPIFNPDGAFIASRANSNQVDLNRNLPTKNWSPEAKVSRYYPGPSACSETENQALVQWLERETPQLVVSLHSWKPMINTNGDCQPEAGILAEATGYKISDYIGYPTPGSLGDYCAIEKNIPAITYEVERGSSSKQCLEIHVPAIKKALYQTEKRI